MAAPREDFSPSVWHSMRAGQECHHGASPGRHNRLLAECRLSGAHSVGAIAEAAGSWVEVVLPLSLVNHSQLSAGGVLFLWDLLQMAARSHY